MEKIFLIIIIPFLVHAQELPTDKITINANSTVQVIADIIFFDITLSVVNEDPKEVYEQHKQLEKKLVQLFSDFSIPDSVIKYSLLSIRKSSRNNDEFSSSQAVKVNFKGTSKYHEFQVELLSNGFYQFRAAFGSSKVEKARRDGYKEALKNAKRDATIIAEELGKELGEITNISTGTNDFTMYDNSNAMSVASVKSLIEIEQSVSARTNLSVTFQLK